MPGSPVWFDWMIDSDSEWGISGTSGFEEHVTVPPNEREQNFVEQKARTESSRGFDA